VEARRFLIEGIIPLVGMLLSFVTVFAIVLVITRARQRRAEIQAELQSKLIEKFGSTAELVAFLQSNVGRQFVNGVQRGGTTLVHDRVLAGLRRAIIVSFLGLGFLALWLIEDLSGLAWPGVLLLVLGMGFFAASLTTMKFARSEEQPLTPAAPPSSEIR
jgi:hypothetical protein